MFPLKKYYILKIYIWKKTREKNAHTNIVFLFVYHYTCIHNEWKSLHNQKVVIVTTTIIIVVPSFHSFIEFIKSFKNDHQVSNENYSFDNCWSKGFHFMMMMKLVVDSFIISIMIIIINNHNHYAFEWHFQLFLFVRVCVCMSDVWIVSTKYSILIIHFPDSQFKLIFFLLNFPFQKMTNNSFNHVFSKINDLNDDFHVSFGVNQSILNWIIKIYRFDCFKLYRISCDIIM